MDVPDHGSRAERLQNGAVRYVPPTCLSECSAQSVMGRGAQPHPMSEERCESARPLPRSDAGHSYRWLRTIAPQAFQPRTPRQRVRFSVPPLLFRTRPTEVGAPLKVPGLRGDW
ncbi:hypothetical protein NDU88_005606 [Pleurodeles waltl]|uniref:Uncharacterized protein n=1 Tax=Pleurodeles waltl TaxID=8319 RepID=A0AAV7VJG5_PLEWA|nr:hypothetical protein NDU88_005606 [Pleurodeles waltl]